MKPRLKPVGKVRFRVRIITVLHLRNSENITVFTLPDIPVTPWFKAGFEQNGEKGVNVAHRCVSARFGAFLPVT